MDSCFSLDFNVFTVIFLLLIFWCLELRLKQVIRDIKKIREKLEGK